MKVEEKETQRKRERQIQERKKKIINLLNVLIMKKLNRISVLMTKQSQRESCKNLFKEKCTMDPQHKPTPSIWI